MQGKNVLITGGSAGIGKAAAVLLARQGAQLTLLGRDAARGEAAAAEVRRASGNQQVSVLACELGAFDELRSAVQAWKERHARLDVLINNAALFLPRRQVTADGLEQTFASIHLGHFLLTRLLLDRLLAAPQGRIVFVTCPPGQARVNFDDLQLAQGYSTLKAQFNAKGAQFMVVRELTRRYAALGLTANTMLPGLMIKTGLLGGMPWYFRLPVQLFGMSPERAAASYSWLAGAPELAGVSGRHFNGRKEARVGGQVADDAACRRLWDLSVQLVGV